MKYIISRFLFILCAAIAGFAMGRFTKNCSVPFRKGTVIKLTPGTDITTPEVGDVEYNGTTKRIYINGKWVLVDTTKSFNKDRK